MDCNKIMKNIDNIVCECSSFFDRCSIFDTIFDNESRIMYEGTKVVVSYSPAGLYSTGMRSTQSDGF